MPANALRQPIPGSDPGGIDLSFLAEFDAIVDARRGDDPSLDQGEWTRELKTADWPRVARLAHDALSERTKDLRIAGWYLEARTQVDGLQGFADGYAVLAALCEEHWGDLHPRGEDDDERLGCLRWIVAQSPRWLKAVPLVGKGSESLDSLPTFAERHPELKAESMGAIATWRRSMTSEKLHAASAAACAALHAVTMLDDSVETHTPGEGPSWSSVRDVLGDVLTAVEAPAGAIGNVAGLSRLNYDPIASDGGGGGGGAGGASGAGGAGAGARVGNARFGPDADLSARREPSAHVPSDADNPPQLRAITDRESALRSLREIARFFRQTEPHSPVAYLADKAARWGTMPLHEWLGQVLGEGEALGRMRDLLDVADEGAPR